MHQSINLSADLLAHDTCLQDFVFIQLNVGLRKRSTQKPVFRSAASSQLIMIKKKNTEPRYRTDDFVHLKGGLIKQLHLNS